MEDNGIYILYLAPNMYVHTEIYASICHVNYNLGVIQENDSKVSDIIHMMDVFNKCDLDCALENKLR